MFQPINFWILVVLASSATCDYYTSISGLEVLLKAERNLFNTLEDFLMKHRVNFFDEITETIAQIEAQIEEARIDSSDYVNNPINAFKLIKRFVSDWFVIDEYVKAEFPNMGLDLNLDVFNGSTRLPVDEDLQGAAKGLARLTETYKLKVSDLAKGIIQGRKYSSEMSASDCLEVGMNLYIIKEYKQVIPWLLEAMGRYKKTKSYNKEAMAELLQYLSVAFFQAGNAKMALVLTHDALQINPTDVDLLENKKVYLKYLSRDRSMRKVFKQPPHEQGEPSVETLYEMTCRGERHQTPSEQRPLRCMYQTNGKPYRLISPFKVEQLSLDPPIVYYHGVLGEDIIARSIREAEKIITRSTVGNFSVSDIRTSKTGWLYYENHKFLGRVATLLADITGLSLTTAEALQIVNYGIGGHYGPHWDFTDGPDTIKRFGEIRGNRIATALFYINDVELGGGTAFPFLKLTVPPEKGSLVLWYNLHESLEPDFRTKHAGCPVLKGSKWILNEWFHERGQDFTRPCSLDQRGEVSKHLEHVK